jgi:protein tyrosine/serine phosphatase
MNSKQMQFLKRSLAAFIVFFVGLSIGLASKNKPEVRSVQDTAPLRNFGVVWRNKLTRSGMPNSDAGWEWLRKQGVKSIVTFRTENDLDYQKFGFDRVLRVPMKDQPPSEAQAEDFLRFVQDPSNGPVHIHCAAGESRTGMMAALVRYAIDGWPLDKALEEARQYRRGRELSEKRVVFLKRWAEKHPPGSSRLEGNYSRASQ